jgi:hypothetical protein
MCETDVDDGLADFGCSETRRSYPRTRTHRCEECDRTLQRGEVHRYVSGKWDGEMYSYRLCLDCSAWSHAFHEAHQRAEGYTCNPELGTLWEAIAEFVEEHLGYDPVSGEARSQPPPRQRPTYLTVAHGETP